MKRIIIIICVVIRSVLLMGQVTNVPYNNRVNTQNLHRFSLLSVEVRPECTILTTKVTPQQDNTYIYASKNDFIEDAETGRKYYIVASDCGFAHNQYIMRDKSPRIYTEIYPALPPNVKMINVYEEDRGYYIKNLKLNRDNAFQSVGSSELAVKGVAVGGPVLDFVKQMEAKGYKVGYPSIEKSMQDDLAIEMYGGEIFDRSTSLSIWYTKTSRLVYKVDVKFGGLNTWDMINATYYFAKQQLSIKYGMPFASDEFKNFAITASYSDILNTFVYGSSYSKCGFLVPPIGNIILHIDIENNYSSYSLRLVISYINQGNERTNRTEMFNQYQSEI